MEKYMNGIDEPSEDDCSSAPEDMDHAVLIVGYSTYGKLLLTDFTR